MTIKAEQSKRESRITSELQRRWMRGMRTKSVEIIKSDKQQVKCEMMQCSMR
jgi:hypothetical protein